MTHGTPTPGRCCRRCGDVYKRQVQTLVIFYAVLGIAGVFLGDVLMMVIDPRITPVSYTHLDVYKRQI